MKKLITLFALIFIILILVNRICAVSVGTGIGPIIPPNEVSCYNVDINHDWIVDEKDLEFLNKWNNTTCDNSNVECLLADLNRDGEVNQDDYSIWQSWCNKTCGPALLVWMCDHREVFDDGVYPGRVSGNNSNLIERGNNYAFEGEKIKWNVLVFDSGGITNLDEVYVTVGNNWGAGNEEKVSCIKTSNENTSGKIDRSCNARISEYFLSDFDHNKMAYYDCAFTIDDTHGENWLTVEAKNKDDMIADMAENEYWFLNPIISLTIDSGQLNFNNLIPGKISYSDNITITNSAEDGSGVLMDMFITGTDFSSLDENAYCPEINKLSLTKFGYYAVNGIYNTSSTLNSDSGGYRQINYDSDFNSSFYHKNDIIPTNPISEYYYGNLLAPSQSMILNFKVDLPRPCNGNFSEGGIYFWGEAV